MKREGLKIKNCGTKEYPYYLVMIGNVEFCATNNEDNAKRIIEALSLPPAEGAEAFIRAKIADHKLHDCYPTFVPEMAQVMTEFASQQPTAEGAEEIGVYDIANKWAIYLPADHKVNGRNSMVDDLYWLLNSHAQRLAEKMVAESIAGNFIAVEIEKRVSERLRMELIKYDKWLCSPSKWGINNMPSPTECVDEYLKTR